MTNDTNINIIILDTRVIAWTPLKSCVFSPKRLKFLGCFYQRINRVSMQEVLEKLRPASCSTK